MGSSENKYRSKERDAYYEQVEKEIAEAKAKLRAAQGGEVEEEEVDDEVIDETPTDEKSFKKQDLRLEETWEKRYGDLKSYHDKEMNKLKAELERAKTSTPSVDMTDEDFSKWMQRYPAVAAAVRRLAREQAEELAAGVNEKLSIIEQRELQTAQHRAYLSLLEHHPDFDEIRQTEEFATWLKAQPVSDQKKILQPEAFDDAAVFAAARVIQFYKLENGVAPKKEKKKDSSAASAVTRKGVSTPDDHSDAPRYSESQIRDMTPEMYAKHRDAIREAQRKGAPYFIRDLSGAAA